MKDSNPLHILPLCPGAEATTFTLHPIKLIILVFTSAPWNNSLALLFVDFSSGMISSLLDMEIEDLLTAPPVSLPGDISHVLLIKCCVLWLDQCRATAYDYVNTVDGYVV